MTKHIVVSFSGGRTSAYMVWLIESMRKAGLITCTVEYIFMDTGMEHPATYDFIRMLVKYFGIRITCLQGDFNQPLGQKQYWSIVSPEKLKYDAENGPYAQLMRKYGIPTAQAPWCTTRMKEDIQRLYCDYKYGENNYITYLGIRRDEPSRLVGKEVYNGLKKKGFNDDDIADMFVDFYNGGYPTQQLIVDAVNRKKAMGLNYLATISDFEKSDILKFWQGMDFDLQIEEHLGNCVFCVKKSMNKIALAHRHEPELAKKFSKAVMSGNDRLNVKNGIPMGVIYKKGHSLESIIAKFSPYTEKEIRNSIRSMKVDNLDGCSESCEAFAS